MLDVGVSLDAGRDAGPQDVPRDLGGPDVELLVDDPGANCVCSAPGARSTGLAPGWGPGLAAVLLGVARRRRARQA
jgi:hypothetical protein